MRRALSLWFPTFSTDLVSRRLSKRQSGESAEQQRRHQQIILLTKQVASRELVARCCSRATAHGVMEEMDLAQARSLLPRGAIVHLEPHQPEYEHAALRALACWALRLAPVAAPDPPDGLMLDVTGTERVHRGEPRLIRQAAAAVCRLGFRVRVAAAPTFACAWAMARFGKHALSRVPAGKEREAIAPLPVTALRVDVETVRGLSEIGVTRIEHVLSVSRASLAARFSGSLLQRLNQALGLASEHVEPVRSVPPPRAEMLFEGPTCQWESLETAAHLVLTKLANELDGRGLGVRLLHAWVIRPDSEPEQIEIHLSQASRNTRHLWSLLRSRLEHVDLENGIEGVILVASRTAPVRHRQMINAATGGTEDHAASAGSELIDTLVSRLGADHVMRLEPVESHVPERAFSPQSVMAASRACAVAIAPVDRPTLLLPRPERAEVMALTPDGPVLTLRWRDRRWNVASCIGPERIGAEWWRWITPSDEPDSSAKRGRARDPSHKCVPPDRDYFCLQLETGQWIWIYRQVGMARWLVHGIWS